MVLDTRGASDGIYGADRLGLSAAGESEQSRRTLGSDQLRPPQGGCFVATIQGCLSIFIGSTAVQAPTNATLDTGC